MTTFSLPTDPIYANRQNDPLNYGGFDSTGYNQYGVNQNWGPPGSEQNDAGFMEKIRAMMQQTQQTQPTDFDQIRIRQDFENRKLQIAREEQRMQQALEQQRMQQALEQQRMQQALEQQRMQQALEQQQQTGSANATKSLGTRPMKHIARLAKPPANVTKDQLQRLVEKARKHPVLSDLTTCNKDVVASEVFAHIQKSHARVEELWNEKGVVSFYYCYDRTCYILTRDHDFS
jgi:hypothetical protein